jgi:hypothetical protein
MVFNEETESGTISKKPSLEDEENHDDNSNCRKYCFPIIGIENDEVETANGI